MDLTCWLSQLCHPQLPPQLPPRDLVKKHVARSSAIVLAVSAANSDLATSDALALAREVDPHGLRTVPWWRGARRWWGRPWEVNCVADVGAPMGTSNWLGWDNGTSNCCVFPQERSSFLSCSGDPLINRQLKLKFDGAQRRSTNDAAITSSFPVGGLVSGLGQASRQLHDDRPIIRWRC